MSKVVIKNIEEISFTPRKPIVIHLNAQQWAAAQKDFKPGGRLPRNGSAIMILPAPDGGVYALPYSGDTDFDTNTIVKPKYDPRFGAIAFATLDRNGDDGGSKEGKRRKRRHCIIGIESGKNPRFKCISISCKGKCKLSAKAFTTTKGYTSYMLYCECSKS